MMKVWQLKEIVKNFERERVIGEITVHIPEPPKDYKEIANWDLPQKDQKFYYTDQPHGRNDPSDAFIAQEFKRFNEGYWFFNNGTLEWLTPFHYFFLNYWIDKGKRMRFIDAQREAALWIREIEIMSNMAGGNLVTNRRFGKTVFATAWAYFRATTNQNHRVGIQSKTNKDGKTVFGKLIKSWQKLPEWLKPLDSGETRPASSLEFSEPRTRGKGKKVYQEVLDSSIDFGPSEEDAYDGEELGTVIEDETGKTITVNTDTRWGVLQFCLLIGSDIIGKALRTTTVEDMEKRGGMNMYKTWKDSMIQTLNEETNMTNSMLTNLFIPADYGLKGVHPISKIPFVDDYGISNRKLATEYILSLWKNLQGVKLKAAQRKNPLTIKHAFQIAENSGTFDPEIYEYLELQKEYLEGTSLTGEKAPKNLRRTVTFYRDDDGMARWKDDPLGHASFVWDFADPKFSNARKMGDANRWTPMNASSFAGGCDPFAATIVSGPGSMGVLYIYRKSDESDPENSGMFVCRYAQRTRLKADFHKMVMIICQYYGCKVNYESDVDDYYETFMAERFHNYVMWRPKCTIDPSRKNVAVKYGTPSKDPFAFQKHFQILVEYLLSRWHKIYFIEFIDQCIAYDIEDRTKSDEVIAGGMALIGGFESGISTQIPNKSKDFIKFKPVDRRPAWERYQPDFSKLHKN